jgi:hypothetical protein
MKRWTVPFAACLVMALAGYLGMRSFIRSEASTGFAVMPPKIAPAATPAVKDPATGVEPGSRAEYLRDQTVNILKEPTQAKRLRRIARMANLQPLSDDGRIQPGMIELLGLNEEQAGQVEQSFRKAKESMAADLMTRLKVTNQALPDEPARADRGPGSPNDGSARQVQKIEHFEIPQSPEEGQGIFETLRRELTGAAGATATDVLLGDNDDALESGSAEAALGGLSKYDIHGNIKTFVQFGKVSQSVVFDMVDSDGKLILESQSSGGQGTRQFLGKTLDKFLIEDPWR